MKTLSEQSIAFFDRESTFAFANACGWLLEGKEAEARKAFKQAFTLTLRLKAEKARQFSTTNPQTP